MSDYFDFLKDYKNIYENASYTEELLESVDSIYKLSSFENQMRKTLETIVNKLISVKLGNVDSSLDLRRKIDLLYSKGIIDAISKDNYHTIRQGGNIGSHALNTMDTYSQQKFYAERRELAENSYKRLYVECHRFVFEYMANQVTIENVANTKTNSSNSSSYSSNTENSSQSTSSVNFAKYDEDDKYNETDKTKPDSNPLLITLKICTYIWWFIYAIWRVQDISNYPHITSTDSLTWLRAKGIDGFLSDYFDMLFSMEVPEFHFIHLGLILCIITAVITYKNNKKSINYNGRNSKGIFSLFIIPTIIIVLSFSFPYSVYIPEGTIIETTYYDKGYSYDKYEDSEWKSSHAKHISAECIRRHGGFSTYRVTTEEGAFYIDLPENTYIDFVSPPYVSNTENYNYVSYCDNAIRCIDNEGNLYMVYIIMPDGTHPEVEQKSYTTFRDTYPGVHAVVNEFYFDSISGIRVLVTLENHHEKAYLGSIRSILFGGSAHTYPLSSVRFIN
ncbi:MAG: DUF4145 domain-containing protein [Lachnospiraceae bacterium]|nr:DUF4145 domain-containing protein [Lachnospiraceae bacterium]